MTDAEFNRDDPAMAEQIMEKLSPSESERQLVLSQLLHSVAATEQLAPNSWSVTRRAGAPVGSTLGIIR